MINTNSTAGNALQNSFTLRVNNDELTKQHYAWCAARDKTLIQAACDLIDNQELLDRGLSIAKILSAFTLDVNLLIAGVVYESFCKGMINSLTIGQVLGFAVNELVLGLNKLELMLELNLCHVSKNEISPNKYGNDYLDSLLTSPEKIKIILLRFALHLHTMRVSNNADAKTKLILAQKTQRLYAPLTKRLNISQMTWELEDLAFKFLHAKIYKEIAALLDERRIERENYILKIKQQLEDRLRLYGIDIEVYGRAKHIYSIWQKMQRKKIDYDAVYDTRALRIILPDVISCYIALGVVHTLWRALPQQLDDYISNPKDNGYESLHTKVIGPEGKILEVQFRTKLMHKEAESGIAAHWRYKDGVYNRDSYQQQ